MRSASAAAELPFPASGSSMDAEISFVRVCYASSGEIARRDKARARRERGRFFFFLPPIEERESEKGLPPLGFDLEECRSRTTFLARFRKKQNLLFPALAFVVSVLAFEFACTSRRCFLVFRNTCGSQLTPETSRTSRGASSRTCRHRSLSVDGDGGSNDVGDDRQSLSRFWQRFCSFDALLR